MHSGDVFGSVRNLVKTSNLPVSKVRQLLHSKLSYTQLTLATRKIKRMKMLATFKNEIWCMDLAYVDKRLQDINGLKNQLVRQEVFDRILDAKGMKTKVSKGTVGAFLTINAKKKESTQEKTGRQGNRICCRV